MYLVASDLIISSGIISRVLEKLKLKWWTMFDEYPFNSSGK